MSKENTFDIDKLFARIFSETEKESPLDLVALFDSKLAEYDLSKRKVLSLLNIDQRTLDDILQGNAKQPNIINILKIAQFLEIEDLNIALVSILRNQDKENIGSIEKAKNASFIAKHFDIKKLSAIGFFSETDNSDHLLQRVLTFFGYESLFQFQEELDGPLFSRTKRRHVDKMKDFWVKSAYACFKNISNQNDFDRESLKEIITKIRPYCQDVENGLLKVCRALYNVGVTVIVQNHLTLTQVRGGTFVVNNKPCIVLTDLNKRYTTIWETLLHELYHVLYDLDTIKAMKYHLTGDPDLLLIEEKAEAFSREFFCNYENYKFIKPHINNPYMVQRFAKEVEIHPSFVYSSFRQFQQIINGKNYYGAFKEFFPDYSLAIKNLSPITWKESSLGDIATNLKSIFEIET